MHSACKMRILILFLTDKKKHPLFLFAFSFALPRRRQAYGVRGMQKKQPNEVSS